MSPHMSMLPSHVFCTSALSVDSANLGPSVMSSSSSPQSIAAFAPSPFIMLFIPGDPPACIIPVVAIPAVSTPTSAGELNGGGLGWSLEFGGD
eukprot:CAMPEP_0198120034 /NCGR_PEP_ID=MMETSP1442-20131203/27771_1 /TAXON_ID= /ORGANISM="Craspedostauros australis, Strain CCMP3328" /LENGTH=92 /DNA_ID=CAMNT_0043778615 /DNA_START=189 /DNA_END=467 /DNA_ORIENTATION=-